MDKQSLKINKETLRMNDNLMKAHDLCKHVLLDSLYQCETRKIYTNIKCSPKLQAEARVLIEEYSPINRKSGKILVEKLVTLIKTSGLTVDLKFDTFGLVEALMKGNIHVLSDESPVCIEKCHRFKEGGFTGLKVVAKSNSKEHTNLFYLFGYLQLVDKETEDFLNSTGVDFSIMKSNKNKDILLMLGPASLMNHDCESNITYSRYKNTVVNIKSLKNINAGEELTCNYGKHYFDNNNTNCLCSTCERKGVGGFSAVNNHLSNNSKDKSLIKPDFKDKSKVKNSHDGTTKGIRKYILHELNGLSKGVIKRRPFCYYCKLYQTQFARHLNVHKDENLVKIYFTEKRKSEKRRILQTIHINGQLYIKEVTGQDIPVKRHKQNAKERVTKVRYNYCHGLFSESSVKLHENSYCFIKKSFF